ncbi:hypothetical protein M0802_014143 [Mischocyttarus mexicanus]|nr:hypothetical protein M0802_014143 [Mischocyttarus mexicanus]
MSRTKLKKLIDLQHLRLVSLEVIGNHLKVKSCDTLHVKIIISQINEVKIFWNKVLLTHEEIIPRRNSEKDSYVVDDMYSCLLRTYEKTLNFFIVAKAELQVNTRHDINSTDRKVLERFSKLEINSVFREARSDTQWDSFKDCRAGERVNHVT